jgi:hypothetical protein
LIHRALGPLVVAAALVVVAAASGSTTAQGFPDTQVVTVTYTGAIDNVYRGPSITSWIKHVEWSLRWSGTVREMSLGDPVFTIVKLKGVITATFDGIGAARCRETLSARPGARVRVLVRATGTAERLTASVVSPITRKHLKSSSESDPACGSNAALGGIRGGSPALRPRVELRFDSRRRAVSKQYTASYDGPGSRGGRERDSLRSTLTLRLATSGASRS